MNYIFHLVIFFNIYVIVAMSLNLIVGYSGLLTLAHATFFAIGAYTYAILTLSSGIGFLSAVIFSVVIAAAVSLVVSLASWRFRGDYFVMASLAAQALLFSIIYNWFSSEGEPGTLKNLTNGPFGLVNIPKPNIIGSKFTTFGSLAIISGVLAGICLILSRLLFYSPWGRLLRAMRDDELAARSLGKNVRLAKVQVFAIACAMVAIAGAIYASYVGYIDPSIASLDHSILMLSMVMVGGVGNFRGPLIGVFVLLGIPEILRFAHIPTLEASNIRLMVYGFLLVMMMHFRPQGLAGTYRIE